MTSPSSITQASEAFFGDRTPLFEATRAGAFQYEPRPQQKIMAVEVARHLETGRHLCVEAPTGVGKTFAYLVPAILHAAARGMPVVVSTHTISLQEQILAKDIPILAGLFDREVTAAVAKGRSNYVCLRRLNRLGDIDQELLGLGILTEIDRLVKWVRQTRTGSRSELDPQPARETWAAVCCERGNCLNAQCSFYKSCFLMKARNALRRASLIIANHALFFSDLAMSGGKATGSDTGLLPAYGAAILDEGHTIEDCACSHLGLRADSLGLRRLLRRLHHGERGTGLLAALDAGAAKAAVAEALRRCDFFFSRIVEWLEPQQDNPLRYTVPGHIENYLDSSLERVESEAKALQFDAGVEAEIQTELGGIVERLHEQRYAFEVFFGMTEPGHVYWFERFGHGNTEVSFNSVPVAVGDKLETELFSRGVPVVVTSATLAVGGSMEFYQQRIGATQADALVLDTPFNFREQVTVYIPADMPSPKNTARFLPEAARKIREFVQRSRGRAFVLFTSYAMMDAMAERLRNFFAENDITLLVQGEGMPRSKMLELFREDLSSVLFGTASFWTGVDVPGEALSNVIIVRLPFSVPDHPLVAARVEQLEREGRNAFRHYTLPDAILRFRQGFGRLIRHREDRGMVVVLDSRILHASYGRAFLQSLPECTVEIL